MNAQATKIAPAVSYTRVASSMKKSQLETQTAFFSALLLQGFMVEAAGEENQVTIKNNYTGSEYTALVVGTKLVILTGEAIKKSGLSLKLNHSIALDTFTKSENAYVLDLEANTVKGAKVGFGWVPADGLEEVITVDALLAVSNTVIVSTKPVDGAIEHFIVGQGKNVAADSIAEARATLTSIIEENGGFVTVEKEPTVRKARVTSFEKQEVSKGTSNEALRVEARTERETRNAYAEVERDAKAEQKRRDRRNAEALKAA